MAHPDLKRRRSTGAVALLATVSAVLAALAGIDWYVRGPFFDGVGKRFAPRAALLRERGGGGDPTIFFDAARRCEHRGIRVAFVGDSTMKAIPGADETIVPYLVREELRKRFGADAIEVIDASTVGLYARDALLFIDKLLSTDVDVVVYGVLLRALPREGSARWTTRVSSQLNAREVARLLAIGGGGWVWENIGQDGLITGIVHSSWNTYAYRTLLKQRASERLALWCPKIGTISPPPPPPTAPPQPEVARQFDWTRAQYGPPNANWDALELLGRLCDRYAPMRCLIFSGPINPEGRDRLAEPGFYEEYQARLRRLAEDYRVVYRDFTAGLEPDDFLTPLRQARDPIHLEARGRVKLAARVVEPVAEIIEAEWPAKVSVGKKNLGQ